MPTYDYRCTKCEHRFELFHSIKDEKMKRCPRCKAKAVRVPSAGAGLLFKGSGFYITDYRSSSYKEQAGKEKSGSPSSDAGSSSDKSGGTTPETKKKPGAKGDTGSGASSKGD